ncbi:MAG: hypothetical protein ACT443_13750 [Gemmatimonadota bacterium]
MKFLWSIVLLASVVFAMAVPIFFGHGLVEHGGPWFALAGVCLLVALALFFIQVRFRPDGQAQH